MERGSEGVPSTLVLGSLHFGQKLSSADYTPHIPGDSMTIILGSEKAMGKVL